MLLYKSIADIQSGLLTVRIVIRSIIQRFVGVKLLILEVTAEAI